MAHTFKPDLPILAPRPLKSSIGSPSIGRKPRLINDVTATSEEDNFSSGMNINKVNLSVTSPRAIQSESFDDKPEIRELYLAAEEELKEIVEGFTHSVVHTLLRADGSRQRNDNNRREAQEVWFDNDDEDCSAYEEFRSIMLHGGDRTYVSPFSTSSFADDDDSPIFPMEGLPHLGGSPSPLLEEQLASDIRNYSLDEEEDYEEQFEWEYYQDEHNNSAEPTEADYEYEEQYEDSSFDESRWMTYTPPVRATNPVSKNSHFGRRLVVVTRKNVVAPNDGERMNDWRQRRKRIMSEPPQRPPAFSSSIECF